MGVEKIDTLELFDHLPYLARVLGGKARDAMGGFMLNIKNHPYLFMWDWKRAAKVAAAGIVPVIAIVWVGDFFLMEGRFPVLGAILGAIWGLTMGIFRKSIFRMMVGLNVGALLGHQFASWFDAKDPPFYEALLYLAFAGALLGVVLSVHHKKTAATIRDGALAGASSFATMGVLAYLVYVFFAPSSIAYALMSVIPFGSGLILFDFLLGTDVEQQVLANRSERS